MTKTIICLDFDGTLVDNQNRIHPRDKELLATGLPDTIFMASTGRPLHSVRTAFEKNGLFRDEAIPLPLVLQNGATVFLPNENLLSFTPFPFHSQRLLIEAALAHPEVSVFLLSFDGIHVIHPCGMMDDFAEEFAFNAYPFREDMAPPRYSKFMVLSDDGDVLREAAPGFTVPETETALGLPTVMEITVSGVTKGSGAKEVVSALSYGDARIIAAGDGENDLPIFEVADIAFAPMGSQESIKARADHVIDTSKNGLLTPILGLI